MSTPTQPKTSKKSIEVEIEVPGTPEQVWQAIATGPGFTSWFVPAQIAERVGGATSFHFGEGMDAPGVVTAWEPPRRFVCEEVCEPGGSPLATEILVESRAGGTCIVRLVNSVFASGTDWDDQLESMKKGWGGFFGVLRLYMTHFAGKACTQIQVSGNAPGTESQAFSALTEALGIEKASVGSKAAATAPGVPSLAGIVEAVEDVRLALRIDAPAPGIAVVAAYQCGGPVMTSVQLFLYGDGAPAVVAKEEPRWRAFMERHFPAVEESAGAGSTTA